MATSKILPAFIGSTFVWTAADEVQEYQTRHNHRLSMTHNRFGGVLFKYQPFRSGSVVKGLLDYFKKKGWKQEADVSMEA